MGQGPGSLADPDGTSQRASRIAAERKRVWFGTVERWCLVISSREHMANGRRWPRGRTTAVPVEVQGLRVVVTMVQLRA